MTAPDSCVFCEIAAGREPAAIVFEDEHCVAFLDRRPVFHGHTLLVPREHFDTLPDVPPPLLTPLFATVQLLERALEAGLGADGSWVAVNTRVSQSVPHVHIHVVPRKFQDGLKGFFWPRQRYRDEAHIASTAQAITTAIAQLR